MAALDDSYDVLDEIERLGLNPDSLRDWATARASMYARHEADYQARLAAMSPEARAALKAQQERSAAERRKLSSLYFQSMKERYGKYADMPEQPTLKGSDYVFPVKTAKKETE